MPVDRIETRVRVPRFVEVDAIDARIQERRDPPRVVAQAVVGRVGHHRVDRARVGGAGRERVGANRGLDRRRREPLWRNRTDDAVAIAQRHEVGRDAAGQYQPVLDRLVAVAIAQRDLPFADRRGEDQPVGCGRTVGHAVAAVGAEDARHVLLVFADRAAVIEQRSEFADADREVGPQQVLAEVVEEDAADRRLEERGAAGVPGRVPRILVFLREPHQRRRERRQQDFEVSASGRRDPPADERRRVLDRPDELVHHLHHVDRDRRGLAALGHEEDGDLVVARPHQSEEPARIRVVAVVAERPVDEHGMDRRVGDDHRGSVLRRQRFHHGDVAVAELLHERAGCASFGGRAPELVIDHQRAKADSLGGSLNHGGTRTACLNRSTRSTGRT